MRARQDEPMNRIERRLHTNLQEEVVVYVEQPVATRENEFGCRIGIEGVNINETTMIYGIDPMQALVLAVLHLDSFVKKISRSISPRYIVWELGAEKDDFGLVVR